MSPNSCAGDGAERPLEHLDGVRLPDEPLRLVGAVGRLDPPQVNPDPERLSRLDRRDHILIARYEDGVGDRPVPGQRLHVGPDLSVDALLLAAGVQVPEPQLDQRHLGDYPLVEGGHPVPGGVVPVHPEQLTSDMIVGLPDQRRDEPVGVDPVLAPGCSAEEQLASGRVDVPDIDHDRVPGEQWERGFGVSHVPSTLAGSEQGVAARRPILWARTRFPLRPGGAYSGMFPCFFGGSVCRFVRSARSALIIAGRVSAGLITAST